MRPGHGRVDRVIPVHQTHADPARRETSIVIHPRVLSRLDRLNVLRVGRVRADPVFLHQRDQIGLAEQCGRGGAADLHLDGGRDEFVANLAVGNDLALPSVVRVDLQVVSLEDDQALGVEVFVGDGDGEDGFQAFRVGTARGQEMAGNQLVEAFFVA